MLCISLLTFFTREAFRIALATIGERTGGDICSRCRIIIYNLSNLEQTWLELMGLFEFAIAFNGASNLLTINPIALVNGFVDLFDEEGRLSCSRNFSRVPESSISP